MAKLTQPVGDGGPRSNLYLNVNSPCRVQISAKGEADPERPKTLYTRNTLYEAKIEKYNRTVFYCKLCQYFVCQGNDKCKNLLMY